MVEAHDPAVPLFTFWAPHIVHTPLQVPAAYYHKFNFIAPTDKVTHERQIYHAMVYAFIGLFYISCLDSELTNCSLQELRGYDGGERDGCLPAERDVG